jgi:hypothetical protein
MRKPFLFLSVAILLSTIIFAFYYDSEEISIRDSIENSNINAPSEGIPANVNNVIPQITPTVTTPTTSLFKNGTYTLPLKGKLDINEKFDIVFSEVKEDSRCPKGAQCIQAGQAIIEVGLRERNDRSANWNYQNLKIGDAPGKYYLKARNGTNINLSISAIDLIPYPTQSDQAVPAYEAILEIKQL